MEETEGYTGYSHWLVPGKQIKSCDACGALVVDTDKHTAWHTTWQNGES